MKTTILTNALILSLSACELRIKDSYTPASLNGNWISNCSHSTSRFFEKSKQILSHHTLNSAHNSLGSGYLGRDTLGQTLSTRNKMHVIDNHINYEINSFQDNYCTETQFSLNVKMQYDMNPSVEDSKSYHLDFRFEEVTLTPNTEAVTEAFNWSAFCGSENWHTGTPKDISNRNCAGTRFDLDKNWYFSLLRFSRDASVTYFDIGNKSDSQSLRPMSAGEKMFIRY